MQLFHSSSSPYARKARVVLREKGLAGKITETECNPYGDPAELRAHNPVGKVPTLVLDDGYPLYDSPVICEFLDTLGTAPRLLPSDGSLRWRILRAHALADGVLDLAVPLTMEMRRPEHERSPAAMERWRGQIRAALEVMPLELATLPPEPSLGHLACAVALGYLDFRHGDIDWRAEHEPLATWYADFGTRPSLTETAPSDASYRR